MSAFAGKNMLMFSVPDQTGFTQARSRSDHSLIARRRMLAFAGSNLIESDRVRGMKALNSPGLCLEIIDQIDAVEMKFLRQMRRLDDPRKIGSLDASIAHWTGNSEAGNCRTDAGFENKFENDFIQPAKFTARINFLVNRRKVAGIATLILLVIGEARMRASNVSG
jgi:hypothetical protein